MIKLRVQVLFHILFQFKTSGAKGHTDCVLRVGTYPYTENGDGQLAAITIFESLAGKATMVMGILERRLMRPEAL
jgi:hypothetical protein